MCQAKSQRLTFETMLSDPMIRLVMASDRVSTAEMQAILDAASHAVLANRMAAARLALEGAGKAATR